MPRGLNVIEWDIETAPAISHIWRPNMQFIPQNMMIEDTFIMMIGWKQWGTDEPTQSVRVTGPEAVARDDSRIVKQFAEVLYRADVIVAHNGDRFDWPHLNGRMAIHQIDPIGYITKIDTLKLAKKNFNFTHNNLDYLGKIFGEGHKLKTDWELWEQASRGSVPHLKLMEEYMIQDVNLLDRVFYRMVPYVDRLARLQESVVIEEDICLVCGSKNKQRRGTYRTQSGNFPKYQCQGQLPNGARCGRYRRGRSSIRHQKAEGHPL